MVSQYPRSQGSRGTKDQEAAVLHDGTDVSCANDVASGNKVECHSPHGERDAGRAALPDEDLPAFRQLLAQQINDSQVKVVAEDTTLSMPAAPPTSLKTDMFAALEQAQKDVAPESITLPT